jgi:hypothetical protein
VGGAAAAAAAEGAAAATPWRAGRGGRASAAPRAYLCLLGGVGGGAVIVLHATVRQHARHGNGAAGEVGVVVQALAHLRWGAGH